MSSHRICVDWERLRIDLGMACVGPSLREVARQTTIPVSGLAKLRNGQGKLSADALARLVHWLYPQYPIPVWISTERSPEDDDEVQE